MIDRLRALASTPIPEQRRGALFVLAAAVLLGAAAFFVLGAPTPERQLAPAPAPVPAPRAPERPTEVETNDAPANPTPREVRSVKATARRFLRGYLPYSYGRGSAQRIQGATDELLEQLAERPPHVPLTATPGREAKVTAVQAEAASAEQTSVLAFVEDSERDYAISLSLERVGAQWRVSDVEE